MYLHLNYLFVSAIITNTCTLSVINNNTNTLRVLCLASGYASKHILSWSMSPEIGKAVAGTVSGIKKRGLHAGTHSTQEHLILLTLKVNGCSCVKYV